MKVKTRLKFILGIISVLALGGALFVYLEYSMSKIVSVEAQLQSDTFTVGVGYSGIVEEQFVDEGDYIKADDPLFELRSPTLAEAIKNDEVAKSSLLYSTTDDGKVLVSASASGRMQKINYRKGAFVPANSEIAVVNEESALYVKASFKLSPPDYAKVKNGSKVLITLPDNTKLTGTVAGIELNTTDKEVYTTIRVALSQHEINDEVFSVGTPVESTLHLDGKTWYRRIIDGIRALGN